MFEVKDTGPLSWTVPIVDHKTGRPSPEFQRRWEQQRSNNSLIKVATFGTGAPVGVPEDGAEYFDITTEPFVMYVGYEDEWHLTGPSGADPTATAGDVAVNGTATTFMRSDGAPAVQKGSSTLFGIVKVDNTTVTAAAGVISVAVASVSDYRSDANSKPLPVDVVWDAADYVALTSGTTVNVDFDAGFNFSLTLAHNATLAAPTNMKAGQTGLIAITQDTGGGFTMAYNSAWKFAGGLDPTLSAAAGAIDLLFYEVLPGGTTVFGSLIKNVS